MVKNIKILTVMHLEKKNNQNKYIIYFHTLKFHPIILHWLNNTPLLIHTYSYTTE